MRHLFFREDQDRPWHTANNWEPHRLVVSCYQHIIVGRMRVAFVLYLGLDTPAIATRHPHMYNFVFHDALPNEHEAGLLLIGSCYKKSTVRH